MEGETADLVRYAQSIADASAVEEARDIIRAEIALTQAIVAELSGFRQDFQRLFEEIVTGITRV